MIVAPTFEPVAHKYTGSDGRPMVSQSQVVSDLKLSPPYAPDRGQKAFGSATHKACELFVQGRLDVRRTDQALIPYVNGFMQKAREMRLRLIASEMIVWHGGESYAGTTDLFCFVYGSDMAVIDLKTGQPPPCVELQLASYVTAIEWMARHGYFKDSGVTLPDNWRSIRRFSMQLTPEKAIVRECTDAYDYDAWIAAVRLWKWKFQRRK